MGSPNFVFRISETEIGLVFSKMDPPVRSQIVSMFSQVHAFYTHAYTCLRIVYTLLRILFSKCEHVRADVRARMRAWRACARACVRGASLTLFVSVRRCIPDCPKKCFSAPSSPICGRPPTQGATPCKILELLRRGWATAVGMARMCVLLGPFLEF